MKALFVWGNGSFCARITITISRLMGIWVRVASAQCVKGEGAGTTLLGIE